jgi:MYXO-CTERM domain-containing protein
MPRSIGPWIASMCLLGLVTLVPNEAGANGQSAHLWITHHALDHLPEGALREFMTRPELRKMLDNGTMFPDGGYPLDDPYAEIAHWEPFQAAYFDWILANHQPPYVDEGAEHLAFMFGMASHGMADQVFDSLYGERVKVYDGSFGDFDTASDLILMAEVGGMTAPSDWVPYEVFDQLYSEAAGYDVDPAVMMNGQNLLRIAVNSVGIFSQMPDKVEEAALPFPWGRLHLLDAEVEGNPPCEGELVARYWRVLWALAHQQGLPGPVLGTLPPDGGANHPIASASLESWVTVAFARGLEDAPLGPDQFLLESEFGVEVPLGLWHYYGQDAHVVHLQPQTDLEPDTIYTVTVMPGVQTVHGDLLEGYAFQFSTGARGPTPSVPEWPADHDPAPDPGDGDGDTDTGTSESGTSEAGDSETSASGTEASDTTIDTDETGGDASVDEATGCGCRTDEAPRGFGLLGLVGLGGWVRRRR